MAACVLAFRFFMYELSDSFLDLPLCMPNPRKPHCLQSTSQQVTANLSRAGFSFNNMWLVETKGSYFSNRPFKPRPFWTSDVFSVKPSAHRQRFSKKGWKLNNPHPRWSTTTLVDVKGLKYCLWFLVPCSWVTVTPSALQTGAQWSEQQSSTDRLQTFTWNTEAKSFLRT